MSDLTRDLDRLIQKAALDGALTEDAVAQFHAIFKKCDTQTDRIEELEKVLAAVQKERDEIATQRDNMQKQILLDAERVGELEKREKEITRLELLAEYSAIRVADHKEMFTTVFRNSVLRKEVMTPVGAGPIDQYGTKQSDVYPTKDTVEEEET